MNKYAAVETKNFVSILLHIISLFAIPFLMKMLYNICKNIHNIISLPLGREKGEVMDGKKEFGKFFGDPFALDYINCTDNVIRRSVTGISAACEILRESADKKGSKHDKQLIDGIMQMCCELMRSAELSKALAAEKLTDEDMSTVRTDTFLRDFAAGCEAASGGRCTVRVVETSVSYIRTDRELLRFLLLGFVRRLTAGGEGGKNAFEVSCGEKLKTLNISVRALRTFVDEARAGQPDVFDSYYREVCMGFAERIGASAKLSDSELTVEIPLPDGKISALTEAPSAEREGDFFDPFAIMLSNM